MKLTNTGTKAKVSANSASEQTGVSDLQQTGVNDLQQTGVCDLLCIIRLGGLPLLSKQYSPGTSLLQFAASPGTSLYQLATADMGRL